MAVAVHCVADQPDPFGDPIFPVSILSGAIPEKSIRMRNFLFPMNDPYLEHAIAKQAMMDKLQFRPPGKADMYLVVKKDLMPT